MLDPTVAGLSLVVALTEVSSVTVGPGGPEAAVPRGGVGVGGVFLFRDLWSPQVRTTSNK